MLFDDPQPRRVQCGIHRIELDRYDCCLCCKHDQEAEDKRVLALRGATTGSIYSTPAKGLAPLVLTPDDVLRDRGHSTTYIEREVPRRLEWEIDLYISGRLAEFRSQCQCLDCYRHMEKK
jgi:hypothetical protein